MDVPASQFKARCLELICLVKDKRVEVIITKRRPRVAKLVPLADEPLRALLGYLRDTVTVVGDITEPVGEGWDAEHHGR